MKTLQLSLEQAKSLHATADKDMKKLLEANFPELKSKVVNNWEALEEVSGFYSDHEAVVKNANSYKTVPGNINIHPTKADLESCLALAQLQQLILRTGDGVSYEEWENPSIKKHVIIRHDQRATVEYSYRILYELAFKTKSIANEFYKKHLPLINTYLKIK